MKFHIHREDSGPLAGFTATPRARAAHAKFRAQKCCRQQQKLTGAVKFFFGTNVCKSLPGNGIESGPIFML